MNRTLERLIENNYTFAEAEEIKKFIKDKKLDAIIQKAIDSVMIEYDDDFEY